VEVLDTDTEKSVELEVKENLATITGLFYVDANNNDTYDAGTDTAVDDIRAFINADKSGGGWQMTQTDDDGTYTLDVTDGDWYVNAFIDPMMSFGSGQYVVVNDGETVTVDSNDADTEVTKNIKVKKLNATITGTVYNSDGETPMNSTYGSVWVFADFGSKDTTDQFKGPGGPGLGTFTDANGSLN